MASPESALLDELFDGFVARMAANPNMELDELRYLFDKCGDVATDPGDVDYLETEVNGTPCLWAVPAGCREDRVLLATHGGGFVTGSRFSHRKLFAHLAKKVGCRALIVDYGRAPEHQFPSQVNECTAVYAQLLKDGIDPSHIATVGDSAGGQLATTIVLLAREQGLPLPAAVMPLSPWYDMEGTGETMKTNAEVDRLVSPEIAQGMTEMYLGDASPRDPLCNPLFANFSGFPPMYIQVGGYEALLDDARRVAERAEKAGVEVQCDVYPEMQHVFHFLAGTAPEANAALDQLAEWVRPRLGLS